MIRLLLLLFSTIAFGQFTITGNVKNSFDEPISQVKIYLSGTTFNTYTNEKGEFTLNVPESNYQLVAQKNSYETYRTDISKSLKKTLSIQLSNEEINLNEAVIQVISKEDRAFYLKEFKRYFLGRPYSAKQCKILNENDLRFRYDKKTNTLKVNSKNPIKIQNNYLGYMIYYDLINFQVDYQSRFVSVLGSSNFSELKNKKTSKKIVNNRLETYKGSLEHFIKSLYQNTITKEGFVIKRLIREENPAYIKYKEELDNQIGDKRISGKVPPKIISYLVNQSVPIDSIVTVKNERKFLNFNGLYSVEYTKAKEDVDYAQNFRKSSFISNQTSIFSILNPVQIYADGNYYYPEDLIVEEYWSYKKIADSLPLDYIMKQ